MYVASTIYKLIQVTMNNGASINLEQIIFGPNNTYRLIMMKFVINTILLSLRL